MGTFFRDFIDPKGTGHWGVFKLPVWESGGSQASNDGGSTLAIFEQSRQKDAAWAYVEYHLTRPESQLEMYQKTDIFPALETTYQDPFFQQPSEYFGGQKVRELFVDVVRNIPEAGVYTSEYQEMNALMASQVQSFALGKQTAQQALAKAAAAIRRYRTPYLFILPFFVIFAVFFLYPIGFSLSLSLHDWSGSGPARFVGLGNYRLLLGDELFWGSMLNATILFLIYVPAMTFLTLMLASLLHSRYLRLQRLWRALIFLPNITSMVAAGYVFRLMLDTDSDLATRFLSFVGVSPIP